MADHKWMIKRIDTNGISCPRMLCDHCKKPIDNAASANAAWNDGGSIHHFHKDCSFASSRKYESSEQLDIHLGYLLHNTGIKTETEFASVTKRCKLWQQFDRMAAW